jgi:hypothetical protein
MCVSNQKGIIDDPSKRAQTPLDPTTCMNSVDEEGKGITRLSSESSKNGEIM